MFQSILVEIVEEPPPDREPDQQRERCRREHRTRPGVVSHRFHEPDESLAKADVDECAEPFLDVPRIGRYDLVHTRRQERGQQIDGEASAPHPEPPRRRHRSHAR